MKSKSESAYFKIFFIYFFCAILAAQEINEDFLNSLPEDIRSDVLTELATQSNRPTKNYNAFTTNIPKASSKSESSIVDDYSQSKFLYSEDLIRNKFYLNTGDIKPFGHGFFKTMPSTFMPINDPSASGDYFLGTDDEIYIQILGELDIDNNYKISRDGSILLPYLGQIIISGLTLSDAKELIQIKAQETFLESDVYVSLTAIRDIQVTILGEIESPGIYTLNGYSNIISALNSAGGLSSSGSMRNISINRNDETILIDLYDFFIEGRSLDKFSLRTGDVIKVNPSSNLVFIHGGVNNPGLYEINKDEELNDLINFAGGMSDQYNESNIQIIRSLKVDSGLYSVDLNSADSYNLKPNDKVFVPFFEDETLSGIKILGASINQGIFPADSLEMDFLAYTSDGYELGIFWGSRTSNGNYTYKVIDRNSFDVSQAQESDIFIILNKSEIDFINSYLFQYFVSNPFFSTCQNFNEMISKLSKSDRENINLTLTNSNESIYPENDNVSLSMSFNNSCDGLMEYPDLASLVTSYFQSAVHLNGDIKNTGFYPIPRSISLNSILKYTGNDDFGNYEMITLSKRGSLQKLAGNFSDPSLVVSSEDKITVKRNSKNQDYLKSITVRGAVNNPGEYYLSSSTSLHEFVSRIGGFRSDSYPFGGVLIRESAKELEKEFNEKLYQDAIKALASLSSLAKGVDLSSIPVILQEFKNIESIGRITVDFSAEDPDTLVLPGDEIYIPTFESVVRVFGEVVNPGTVAYLSSLDANDYVKKAGGFTQYSDRKSAIVVSPNGEARILNKSLLFGGSTDIYPGSVIYVPRDTKSLDGLEFASAISPIVSSLALSLASLNSISN